MQPGPSQPGPIAPDEVDEFIAAVATAFHDTISDEDLASIRRVHEPGRELVVRDGGRIVATTTIASFDLTVPGGPIPVAGITAVGVRPTHRRGGLGTALMRAQLDGLRDGGEAVAVLWASEARIYGRFGYGPATRVGGLRVRTLRATLRPEVVPQGMRAEQLGVEEALPQLRAVHDAARPRTVGMISRSEGRWAARIDDAPDRRDGAGPLRALVVRGPEGAPEGYATYGVKQQVDDGEHANEVVIREVVASTRRGELAVWQQLIALDLVTSIAWEIAPADPILLHALTNPRALRSEPDDGLWIRLVRIGEALAARRYGREIDLVLDVQDAFCPWNTGRHRLTTAGDGTATCEPTSDPADLRLGIDALAAAYLGGPSLRALADAGRVEEHTPGAVDAAAAAFRGTREPWCPDMF